MGDAKLSGALAENLLQRGVYVTSFSYPVVPKDTARIRVQVSAAHTQTQLTKAVAAFIGAGKEVGVIGRYTADAYEKFTEAGRKAHEEEWTMKD